MMNSYFLIAGILCFLLGIVHSILGEVLIFKEKRTSGNLIPSIGSKALKERNLRIIWATWHLATIFGWCLGMIILKMAYQEKELDVEFVDFLSQAISCSMLFSALLVLIGTKGKHPGWVVLLLIGVLMWMG